VTIITTPIAARDHLHGKAAGHAAASDDDFRQASKDMSNQTRIEEGKGMDHGVPLQFAKTDVAIPALIAAVLQNDIPCFVRICATFAHPNPAYE
jgi:hypothetical protein